MQLKNRLQRNTNSIMVVLLQLNEVKVVEVIYFEYTNYFETIRLCFLNVEDYKSRVFE
jgi:hypothetical protein